MGIINETTLNPLAASLQAGVKVISQNQSVSFQQYNKYVMPTDGSVFWVASGSNIDVNGSIHILTERHQDEDQTIASNKSVFTSLSEVTQFNNISPSIMWVGSFENLQIVFSDRGSFYEQSGLWHYSGYAVYPALSSQLINSISDLPAQPIVSNSLPIWLSLNTFAPVYPSYLVPDNVVPPYIAVHIIPDDTETLAAMPIYTNPTNWTTGLNPLTSTQLMRDKVKLTLYGFTNQLAIQYLSSLFDYSLNTDNFGFCNSPSIRDDKRTQVEIAAIAMKKTINILASYYQGTADAIQRRLILSASINTNV